MMEVYYFTVLEAGNLLSHSSGGQKSRVKVWQVRFLDRARFMVCRQQPSHCVLSGGGVDGWEGCGGLEWGDRKRRGGRERERERKASSSSYEDTNPIGSWPHPYDLNLTLITS